MLERAAERRGDAAFLAAAEPTRRARLRDRRRTRRAAKTADGSTRCSLRRSARARAGHREVFLGLAGERRPFRRRARPERHRGAEGAAPICSSSTCARSPCRGWSVPSISRRSPRRRRCCWHARHRFCANCGAPTTCRGRLEARMPVLQGEHFPRTDPVVIMLAIDGDRCLLGRQARFGRHVVVPCRLHRAGRDHRGCGAARDAGGSRHRLRRGQIFRLAALAVSDVADDRLPCAGASTDIRSTARSSRTRAGSPATRSRDAEAAPSGGLSTPPPIAIAHHIIRAWVEGATVSSADAPRTHVLCAGIAVLDMCSGSRRFRARKSRRGERIPHGRRRHAPPMPRSRSRGSARARALPARSAGRRRRCGRRQVPELRRARGHRLRACPRVADVPSPISAICIDRRGERAIANFRDERLAAARAREPGGARRRRRCGDRRQPLSRLRARRLHGGTRARHSGRARRRRAAPRQQRLCSTACSHVVFSAEGCARPRAPTISARALRRRGKQTKSFLAVTDGANDVLWLDNGELRQIRPSRSTWSTRSVPATCSTVRSR